MIRKKVLTVSFLVASILTGLILGLGKEVAFAQAPFKVRVAYGQAPLTIIGLLFQKPEILKNYGKSYVVEGISFRGTSPQIQAFAAKELEVGYLAYASFPFAITKARLDVKIVADMFQDGVPGFAPNTYWTVLADSPIKKIEDLRGKTIGINLFNTGVDINLRTMMKKYGMEYPRDYNIVEVSFPNQEAFLREKKIDVACLILPFWYPARQRGGIRHLFTSIEAIPKTQFLFTIARSDFLRDKPEIARDFFEDWLIAWRWFLNPANRAEAHKLAAKVTKRKIEDIDWAFTEKDMYRHPDGIPDLETLQKNIDQMVEIGLLDKTVDVAKYVDLSFVKEAKKRLEASGSK